MIKQKTSVYERVTNRILENLKKGVVPWRKSWQFVPQNFYSKHEYKGCNFALLSCNAFTSPYYATFKQIKQSGHNVKKDSKAEMIVFWKFRKIIAESDEDEDKVIPMIRYYNVFNIEQTTIEVDNENQNKQIVSAETVINSSQNLPEIQHINKLSAHYSERDDVVNVPSMNLFESSEDYYSVVFHELIHSTGHRSRLNRATIANYFKSKEERAKEEMIAEIGASYLCAYCGIENFVLESESSYIDHWLSILNNDKRIFIHLASQAQKAAEFILSSIKNEAQVVKEHALQS